MTNEEIVEYVKARHPSFMVEDDGKRITMTVQYGGQTWGMQMERRGDEDIDPHIERTAHLAALRWAQDRERDAA